VKQGHRKRHSSKKVQNQTIWIWPVLILAAIALAVSTRRRTPPSRVESPPVPSVTATVEPSNAPPVVTVTDTPDWRREIENLPQEERAAAYSDKGDDLLAEQRYADAVEAFRKSLDLDAASESVHYNHAIALAAVGQTNEAIVAYEQALKIAPDYAEAHNNLGNLLLRRGDYEEAMKHFREAISVNPADARGYNNLGIALARQGQQEQALNQFAKAVELDPAYLEARFNLAQAHAALKQNDKAADQLRAVLKLSPNFAPAQRALDRVTKNPAN
jgi:tetratricopeptide (TPR) repeat protein